MLLMVAADSTGVPSGTPLYEGPFPLLRILGGIYPTDAEGRSAGTWLCTAYNVPVLVTVNAI